jgi:orotidine-5'-phosphate decarboxylase
MSFTFQERLQWAIRRAGVPICVGIDPDPERIPPHLGSGASALEPFVRGIVSATQHLVAAFKPNTAFFEAYGSAGWAVLEKLRDIVGPEVLLIIDAKRGDIEHTNAAYAHALFDRLKADAVTVQPYLGGGPLEPFLRNPGRAAFVLCATSNRGAEAVQNLRVEGDRPLYLEIARQARSWSEHQNVGLVVGSTKPEALAGVLRVAADLPLLIPGGGAQGGDSRGIARMVDAAGATALFNYSRTILYASRGKNFADMARLEVLKLHDSFMSEAVA